MAEKLFGTDGIRGKVNRHPITPYMMQRIAMASALYIREQSKDDSPLSVIIAKDTRISSYTIETALSSGFTAMGISVKLVGPLPTPALPMLVKSFRADFGVMISASHNFYYDNGIKFFDSHGNKFDDSIEKIIEANMDRDLEDYLSAPNKMMSVSRIKGAQERYIEYVKSTLPKNADFTNISAALDCANGAAYYTAPSILTELRFKEVNAFSTHPSGTNINDKCGSTYTDSISGHTLKCNAHVGITLDGDADRVLISDSKGRIIDGDKMLAALAVYLKSINQLKSNTVVGTIMSNSALEEFLDSHDIKFVRVDVGDKNVVNKLRSENWSLGGEPSGHVILKDYSSTGDGTLAGLHFLYAAIEYFSSVDKVYDIYTPYFVTSINVPYESDNINKESSQILLNNITSSVDKMITQSKAPGRAVIRFSGTEALVRVMIECADKEIAADIAEQTTLMVGKMLSK